MVIEQQLKCGSTMKFVDDILRFFKKIRPRYLLSLDSNFYNLSKKSIIYRFKVFGEHTFPKFTFNDIKNNKTILYDIHPVDLMKITWYVKKLSENVVTLQMFEGSKNTI